MSAGAPSGGVVRVGQRRGFGAPHQGRNDEHQGNDGGYLDAHGVETGKQFHIGAGR